MIDGNTKVIARMHTKLSPRGLNIYNPYFDEKKVNAVYLLFYNSDPKILLNGVKNLNFAGAVAAGFETDPDFYKLLDEYDESSKIVGRVGFVKRVGGKLRGYCQSGRGQLLALQSVTSLGGKDIVIVGAGVVAQSLLWEISRLKVKPKSVVVLNRTADKLKKIPKYTFIRQIGGLNLLESLDGDILINATDIGGSVADNLFTSKIVDKYNVVSDLTFETENTNLLKIAKKLDKKCVTGWDMFTYQGQVVLETILETKINAKVLKKFVVAGLSEDVK